MPTSVEDSIAMVLVYVAFGVDGKLFAELIPDLGSVGSASACSHQLGLVSIQHFFELMYVVY